MQFWCDCRGRVRRVRPRDLSCRRRVDVIVGCVCCGLLVDDTMLRLLPMDTTFLNLQFVNSYTTLRVDGQPMIERQLEMEKQSKTKSMKS